MKSKIIFSLFPVVLFYAVFACSSTEKKPGRHADETSASASSSSTEPKTGKHVNPNTAAATAPASAPATAPAPARTSAPANSIASVNSNKIPVSGYYFGFNTEMIHGPDWSNGTFIDAVKNLHPENIRYPGGHIANYWDWKKGWFMKTPNLPDKFKNIKANPITLENFKLGIDATGAMPVFVLNMLTSDIKNQLEMLHHAKDIGLAVKFIELGNEYHGSDENGVARFATGKDYALEANKWIAAIKKDFPDARIAAAGCGKAELKSNNYTESNPNNTRERVENWDQAMFANLVGADAVVFHVYPSPSVQTGKNKVKANQKKDVQAQRSVKSAFDNNVEMALGAPFLKLNDLEQYNNSSVPKGMKIWYTEYNLFEKNYVVSGTWTHGLYVSLMSVLFLNLDRTEFICNHDLAARARFGAIFNDDNGFENHLDAERTTPFTYTAGGACLSLVGQAISGKTAAQQLNFSNTKMLKSQKQSTYPSLLGYKFTGNGKESAIIFNLDASSLSVDVSKVASGNMQFKTYSDDPLKQITDHKQITVNTGTCNGTLNLPAYSITVVY